MVLSKIWDVVCKDLTNSVVYFETAQEAWMDLQERFSQGNAAQIYRITRDISNHVQDQLTVLQYFTTLKGFWDDIDSLTITPKWSCGAVKEITQLKQNEMVFQFLMGLNDSFSNVRSNILTMDPLPSMNKAYALILQDERARSDNNYANQFRGRGNGCGGRRCDRPRFDHCGYFGHVRDQCHKLHGWKTPRNNVTAANTSNKDNNRSVENSIVVHLSPEQHSQLMSLLNIDNSISSANLDLATKTVIGLGQRDFASKLAYPSFSGENVFYPSDT
ncbi:uncharacterized protein LOC105420580 [Amborella trichopoda]|uniref:uncharacterized protein LOC105420580 n=1 Tax=Amborella trichopoda TaxID=13333 RepID=UPI0005D316BB|nr:uncharacterized protein LOC105420580 [Amborella trichopoda]|eukprot:XP_011622989.1 uncharacterized protein LOC105420580 [Amborella trichopoda]